MRREFGMSAHEVEHGESLGFTPAWEIEMLQRQRQAHLQRQDAEITAVKEQAGA